MKRIKTRRAADLLVHSGRDWILEPIRLPFSRRHSFQLG